VHVDRAAIAVYECRCCERLLSERSIEFRGGEDASPASPEEAERVRLIVGEASQDDYWFAASRDGNRASHYRGPGPSSNSVVSQEAGCGGSCSGSGASCCRGQCFLWPGLPVCNRRWIGFRDPFGTQNIDGRF
jgi:hypothetical protein